MIFSIARSKITRSLQSVSTSLFWVTNVAFADGAKDVVLQILGEALPQVRLWPVLRRPMLLQYSQSSSRLIPGLSQWDSGTP